MQGWNPSLISEQYRNQAENSLPTSKGNKEMVLYQKKTPMINSKLI